MAAFLQQQQAGRFMTIYTEKLSVTKQRLPACLPAHTQPRAQALQGRVGGSGRTGQRSSNAPSSAPLSLSAPRALSALANSMKAILELCCESPSSLILEMRPVATARRVQGAIACEVM